MPAMPEMSTIRLIATAIWASSHVTQYGLAITSLNGISDAVTCNLDEPLAHGRLNGCIDMPATWFGIVVSIFTLGGLAGSLASDSITRRLGRLNTFRLAVLCLASGNALVGLSNSIAQMLIGRIIIGLGAGLATVSVPLFLGEIAPPAIKKALGIMNQLFIVVGMAVGQALALPWSHYATWRWVFAVPVVLGAAQIGSSYWIEVPQIKKDAKRVSDGEASPLLGPAEDEDQQVLSIKDLFTSKDVVIRRGLYVVLATQFAQQLCGVSPVMYFSTRILKPVFNANSRLIALGIVLFKLPLTMIPAIFIERSGTRPILLFSAFTMIICAVGLALGLNSSSGAVSAVSMVSYVSFYSCGLGPVSWVVLSEVMPSNATTAAGAIGIALNWVMNFIMGSAFLPVQQALSGDNGSGEGNVFYILAINCAVCFLAIRATYAGYDAVKKQ